MIASVYAICEMTHKKYYVNSRNLKMITYLICTPSIIYFQIYIVKSDLDQHIYTIFIVPFIFQSLREYYRRKYSGNLLIGVENSKLYDPCVALFIQACLLSSIISLSNESKNTNYLFSIILNVIMIINECFYILKFAVFNVKSIPKDTNFSIIRQYVIYMIFAKYFKTSAMIFILCVILIFTTSNIGIFGFDTENSSSRTYVNLNVIESYNYALAQGIGGSTRFFPINYWTMFSTSVCSMMGFVITGIGLSCALDVRGLLARFDS